MTRPVILTFARYYLPGFQGGGPIRSIANMVEWLGDEFDFRIVTLDRDHMTDHRYPDIPGNDEWTRCGKALVRYISPNDLGLSNVRAMMREEKYDLLYLNSFFDPSFTLKPLFLRWLGWAPQKPVLVAPRGELSPGSLSVKRWKKRIFLQLVERAVGLYRDVHWHAAAEHEAKAIRNAIQIGSADFIHSAIALPAFLPRESVRKDKKKTPSLKICFLSRISPEKNLDYALEVLKHVKADIIFNIYGPVGSAAYWERCEGLIKLMPSNVQVKWHGAVTHNEVTDIIASHDLFFLPSKGESFGHAIAESLSAGTPVLLSDTTPWRGLEGHGVGWDLPLSDADQFSQKIDKFSVMTEDERNVMREKAAEFVVERMKADGVEEATRKMLLDAAGWVKPSAQVMSGSI